MYGGARNKGSLNEDIINGIVDLCRRSMSTQAKHDGPRFTQQKRQNQHDDHTEKHPSKRNNYARAVTHRIVASSSLSEITL
jgi:hypothetical protein